MEVRSQLLALETGCLLLPRGLVESRVFRSPIADEQHLVFMITANRGCVHGDQCVDDAEGVWTL